MSFGLPDFLGYAQEVILPEGTIVCMNEAAFEIAATAARMVVEDGLAFGPAKHRALKALGLPVRTALPSNDEVEAQVLDYIALFCADSQAQELAALRALACQWMARLQDFPA
jgi:hypothetical protein